PKPEEVKTIWPIFHWTVLGLAESFLDSRLGFTSPTRVDNARAIALQQAPSIESEGRIGHDPFSPSEEVCPMPIFSLYPLRFEPILRRLIWGGRRLGTVLHKPIGEGNDYA